MVTTTCCCCIPLRAGVGIIASISLAFYAACTALLFVYKNEYFGIFDSHINGVSAIFWTAVGISITWLLASLMGLIGVSTQRRGLIIVFSTFNWIMAFLTLGVSLAVFILLLARQQDAHNNCIAFWNTQGGPSTTENSPSPFHTSVPVPGNQQSIEDYCNNAIRALIIAAGVCTFVGNGIQLYFASMVGSYSTRLKRFRQHVPLRDLEYTHDKNYMNPYPY